MLLNFKQWDIFGQAHQFSTCRTKRKMHLFFLTRKESMTYTGWTRTVLKIKKSSWIYSYYRLGKVRELAGNLLEIFK